jgi:hypothetical protein
VPRARSEGTSRRFDDANQRHSRKLAEGAGPYYLTRMNPQIQIMRLARIA